MPQFLTAPVTPEAARAYLDAHPAEAAEVVEALLEDIQGQAAWAVGMEGMTVWQQVRDRIADLKDGADWGQAKIDILHDVSPFLLDPGAPPEDHDSLLASANRRAELLIRLNGTKAYQSAAYQIAMNRRAAYPLWRYLTMEDVHVRQSHAVLDGMIVPADSAFWLDHYPPWDWGCRCQVVPINIPQYAKARAADADRPLASRKVLTGHRLRRLELTGYLIMGLRSLVNCASPVMRRVRNAFRWTPGDLRPAVKQALGRFDAPVRETFENWCKKQSLPSGKTLHAWLHESPRAGGGRTPGGGKPGKKAVPAPAPVNLRQALADIKTNPPNNPHELIRRLGIDMNGIASPAHMDALAKSLFKPNPMPMTKFVKGYSDPLKATRHFLTQHRVESEVQAFIDMLPPHLASLPRFRIKVVKTGNFVAQFNHDKMILSLNARELEMSSLSIRQTVWHELVHWAGENGPDDFRDRMKRFFAKRTNHFRGRIRELPPYYDPDIVGFEDDFLDAEGDAYAGRVYYYDDPLSPSGAEIATTHIDKLGFRSDILACFWNYKSQKTGRYAWREGLCECLHLFFPF